jgi:hypothetical protein
MVLSEIVGDSEACKPLKRLVGGERILNTAPFVAYKKLILFRQSVNPAKLK